MESVVAIIVGVFFAASIYLLLSKHTIRILLGVVLLGNGANLLLITAGRFSSDTPPVIPEELYVPAGPVANPLPQALVLTAIVISFSLLVYLLVLAYRAYQDIGTDDTDAMRLAEPSDRDGPPRGY